MRTTQRPPSKTSRRNPAIHANGNLNIKKTGNLPIFHTRFAPTPSGYLHLGNALSFAIAWAIAKQQNGIITLRIDDLYNTHFKTEHLEDIFDTLSFLELDYQNGPKNTEDFLLHHSQQNKLDSYNALLNQLIEMNKIYACACSRSQLQQHTIDGHYNRICLNKNLDLDSPDVAWRIKIPLEEVVEVQDQLLGTIQVPLGKTMPDFSLLTGSCNYVNEPQYDRIFTDFINLDREN